MFRSDDVILVTRDGAPAGVHLPWDNPELPVEVRREVFLRLYEQIGTQLVEQGASEDAVLDDFAARAVVADANAGLDVCPPAPSSTPSTTPATLNSPDPIDTRTHLASSGMHAWMFCVHEELGRDSARCG